MKNFMISLKRFISNKNTITIICALAAVLIIFFGYNYRVNQATNPISVPYAKQDIQPRTQITEDMIGYMEVPSVMVQSNTIRNSNDLIGYYANYNTMIPAGSLFYSSTIVSWSQMPDSAWSDIPDGFTIVSLNVNNETTYGNSIFPGNYIDLYYVTHDNSGRLLVGKLIESIEVLAVKDSAGNHVFENSANLAQANSLIFAVPEDLHILLRKASYLSGDIIPVPRNQEYSQNPGETRVDSEYIRSFIENQTVCLPGQCGNTGDVGTID